MNQSKNPKIPRLAGRVWRDPVLWLAFGFGTGLAPKAPGTVGTLPGIVLAAIVGGLAGSAAPVVILLMLMLLIPLGVWLCGEASRRLGVHDYGGIVFDEVVGVLIPFLVLPITPVNLLLGFLAFRLFDVWKPWPISWLDRRVHGGLGIMIDDLLAGAYALAAVWAVRWVLAF